MKKDRGPSDGAKIISLQDRIIKRAVSDWHKGNIEGDADLIERAGHQLEHFGLVSPIAKYFSAAANIQLMDNNTQEHLSEIFEALEVLLEHSESDNSQIIRSCKEILEFLAKRDGFFKDDYRISFVPTIQEIRYVLMDINNYGITVDSVAKLYTYLRAYLNG